MDWVSMLDSIKNDPETPKEILSEIPYYNPIKYLFEDYENMFSDFCDDEFFEASFNVAKYIDSMFDFIDLYFHETMDDRQFNLGIKVLAFFMICLEESKSIENQGAR